MKVLLDGLLPRRGEALLARHFGDRAAVLAPPDGADVAVRRAAYADAEVLIAMGYDGTSPPAPRLRLLQLPIAGLDMVDLAAVPAAAAVCNVYEHEVGIAEYCLAGMLEWTIDLAGRSARFKAGSWEEGPKLGGPTRGELQGQTVGIVGYGRIGQAICTRARAFGMRVEAVTRAPRPFEPAPDWLGGYGEIERLCGNADFVVVAAALDEATRGIVGRVALAAMKPSAVLFNVARGPVADEDAVFAALQEGRIRGAVLDVWWNYPELDDRRVRPSRHPFHELPNVLMTPHLSGWTNGNQTRRWQRTIENIENLIAGRPLINVVRPAAG